MNIRSVVSCLLVFSLLNFTNLHFSMGDTPSEPADDQKHHKTQEQQAKELGIVLHPVYKPRPQARIQLDFATPFDPRHASTPIFKGTKPEIRRKVLKSLMKPEIGSVALLAEAGVGKSATVNSIAYDIINDDVPSKLQGYDVFILDVGGLSKGSERPGVIEEKIKNMIQISKENKIIWVIDEIHSMRGQGTHEGNTNDVFQLLKPAMAAGIIKIIGMSTPDEFHGAFAGDTPLLERFTLVNQKAPEGDELKAKIRGWAYARYQVILDDYLIERAIEMSEEFDAIGNQPRKTTSLLQEAFSILDFEDNSEELSVLTLTQAAIDRWDISEAFFDPYERLKLVDSLPEELANSIVGQKEALKHIHQETLFAYTGVAKQDRPRVSTILAGPPGTGKTETVFAYGKAMGLPVKRILMSKFATTSAGDIDRLKNEIYQALNKNRFSIIFFDEIEKCPIFVQDALLGLLDKGKFTVNLNIDTTGRTQRTAVVDATKSTVFFGTNAGTAAIVEANKTKQRGIGFSAQTNKTTLSEEALKEILVADNVSKPLVDRTSVVVYNQLNKEEFSQVLALHIRKALDEIGKGAKVEFAVAPRFVKNAAQYLTDEYFQSYVSTRFLNRIIDSHFRLPLSRIFKDYPEISHFEITFEDGNNGKFLFAQPQRMSCARALRLTPQKQSSEIQK